MLQCNDKELNDVILELNELNICFKQAENDYKKKKEQLSDKIRKLFKIKNIDTYNFLAIAGRYKERNQNLKITDVRPKSISFDAEKLEAKLGSERCKPFVKKAYAVNDMKGLTELLKAHGVKPGDFKRFIDVTKTVDSKKIDQLAETGGITYEEIKGCYTAKDLAGYIKITEVGNAESGGR